jgi:hypothetical protein
MIAILQTQTTVGTFCQIMTPTKRMTPTATRGSKSGFAISCDCEILMISKLNNKTSNLKHLHSVGTIK